MTATTDPAAPANGGPSRRGRMVRILLAPARIAFFSMVLVYQSLLLALGQIWANKVRAMLTTIGIVIGIASVTAVIAVLTGLQTKVLSEFESFGANKLFIFWRRPDHGPLRNASQRILRFRADEFDDMPRHCPSVACFTRIGFLSLPVTHEGRAADGVQIRGIDPDWHSVEHRSVVEGRPFSLVDNSQGLAVCMVTPKLRDKLALDRECVGDSIQMGGRRFLVVGVVESRPESSMFGGGGSGHEVFIPFRTAMRMAPELAFFVIASSRSPDVSEEAKAEISFYMRRQRQIKPGDPDTFGVEAVDLFIEKFRQVARTITLAAGGVVAISLLVGGVGIMNIMLVSVSERTREIGLRKAVGARPSAILLQFLIEAIVLCCIGGALGLLAGQGLTSLVRQIPDSPLGNATVPPWAVALSFGFASSVGLVFGIFPAIKAARLNPIDALRHE